MRKPKAASKAQGVKDVEMGGGSVMKKVKKLGLKKSEKKKKPGFRKAVAIPGMTKALRLKPLSKGEQKKNEKFKKKWQEKQAQQKQEKQKKNERTICVRNLDFKISGDMVKKDFAEAGAIECFDYPTTAAGVSKGIAIIKYTTKEACDKALLKHGDMYHHRELSVLPRGSWVTKVERTRREHDGTNKVSVKNLPFNITESSIKAAFEKCGGIVSVEMPPNSGGGCRGIAFVKFETAASAQRARSELDGKKLEGRSLVVRDYGLDKAVRAKIAGASASKRKGAGGKTLKTKTKQKSK